MSEVFFRLGDARPMLQWFTSAVIEECGLTIHVLPDEILSNRRALTRHLKEQLNNLSRRKASELEALLEKALTKKAGTPANENSHLILLGKDGTQ